MTVKIQISSPRTRKVVPTLPKPPLDSILLLVLAWEFMLLLAYSVYLCVSQGALRPI